MSTYHSHVSVAEEQRINISNTKWKSTQKVFTNCIVLGNADWRMRLTQKAPTAKKAKSQKPHSHKGEVVKSKVVKSLRKFLPLKRKQQHENENRPKKNWNIFINFFWNLLAKCLNMASICLKKFRCGVVAHEKITDQREAKKQKGKRRRRWQPAAGERRNEGGGLGYNFQFSTITANNDDDDGINFMPQ